jgi:hypothetical protein
MAIFKCKMCGGTYHLGLILIILVAKIKCFIAEKKLFGFENYAIIYL